MTTDERIAAIEADPFGWSADVKWVCQELRRARESLAAIERHLSASDMIVDMARRGLGET